MQTEEMEEAEGLKGEITTVARGLRVKEQNTGERKDQGNEEEKSRGCTFMLPIRREGGRKIQEKNMQAEMNSYKKGKTLGESNNSGMQESSYLRLNPDWIARALRQTAREVGTSTQLSLS